MAGCVLKKPPDAAAIKAEAMPKVQVPAQWTAAGAGAGAVADNWLATFNDQQLTAAVAEAIANNADLRVGAARVEQALLYAKLAGAKLYPSVDLLARGGGKMSGDDSGLKGALLTVTWEIDLWGRVRYGRAAAAADALGAGRFRVRAPVDRRTRRQKLVPGDRGGPAGGGGADDDSASEELVRLAADATRSRRRQRRGHVTSRARGRRPTATRSARSSSAREQALRALEILLGRYPAGRRGDRAAAGPAARAGSGGLPSELLERRPDVIAAERRVAAAFNRVGEAKAARLPAIALTTGVSTISSDLFVLQNHDNPVWNLGANLVAPIYRGGALKTQVEIRTAEQKQAVAAYASVGLRAFGEVESALAAEIAARDREQILGADARRQPARARDRADPVQGRQHRPPLRQRSGSSP